MTRNYFQHMRSRYDRPTFFFLGFDIYQLHLFQSTKSRVKCSSNQQRSKRSVSLTMSYSKSKLIRWCHFCWRHKAVTNCCHRNWGRSLRSWIRHGKVQYNARRKYVCILPFTWWNKLLKYFVSQQNNSTMSSCSDYRIEIVQHTYSVYHVTFNPLQTLQGYNNRFNDVITAEADPER